AERSFWSWREIGGAESMVSGAPSLQAPEALRWGLMLLSFASFAVIGAVVSTLAMPTGTGRDGVRETSRAATPFLIFLLGGHFVLVVVLWLTNDRYCLPMLPVAIALVFAARPVPVSRAAIASLVLLAVLSL